jgi:pilus assembly protein CpaB
MTFRTVLIVVLAVVFGVAAAVYATNALNRTHEAAPEEVAVLVTIKDLPKGSRLTADMLEVKNVAKKDAPLDALHTLEDALKNGGRVASVDFYKGEPVLERKLAKEGQREGMATLIKKNDKDDGEWMQAATILTPTASSGVGGFLRPDDFVDVLLTVDHFGVDDRGGTTRLMQRVRVLATDNRMEANPTTVEGKVVDQREMRYVTLLVKPKQAQELALAQKQGMLTLILRNPEDTTELPTVVVTGDDLKLPRKEGKKPDVPAANKTEPPPPPIRVIKAGAEASGSAP